MANPNTDVRKYYKKKKTGNVVISTISHSFDLCTIVKCSKTGLHILGEGMALSKLATFCDE